MSRGLRQPAPLEVEVEVDTQDEDGWNRLLAGFSDASIYQTWAYEAVHSGERRMSHLLLRRGGCVVAAAQVRVVRIPLLGRGAAYVRWGPMWQPAGAPADPAVLALALKALRDEYVVRRGLSLRVLPRLFDDEAGGLRPLLGAQGFASAPTVRAQRTLLLPIDRPQARLRADMHPKWRSGLNQAERNGLAVAAGSGDELFAAFVPLYAQMHARKGFRATSDVAEFRAMQRRLPEPLKLRVWIASSRGKPVAGLVGSAIGDMGLYLFGATADAGLPTKASSLLQWQMVCWLQQQGTAHYNLHGIDPLANPGTFHFKAGLCGRHGRDLHYLGGYDAWGNRADAWLWQLANAARAGLQATRGPLASALRLMRQKVTP